jgi:branched-chain amino acid transport system permease protein
VFRRLDDADYPATIQLVATLGIYTVTVGVVGLVFGQQSIQLNPSDIGAIALPLEIRLSPAQGLSITVAAATVVCFHTIWRGTRLGLRLRAMADDVSLARIVGIPVSRYATSTFAAGFALLGVAGILGAFDSAMRPNFAFPLVVVAMVAVAVGQGNARLAAALGASGVIAIAETAVAWLAGEAWARAVSLVCLILILAWAGTQRRQSSRSV